MEPAEELVFIEANILLLIGDFSELSDVVFNALLGEWDRSEPTGTLDEPPAFTCTTLLMGAEEPLAVPPSGTMVILLPLSWLNFEGEKELSNGEAEACADETVLVAVAADDAATDVDASFS